MTKNRWKILQAKNHFDFHLANTNIIDDFEYREIAILHENATFGELALIEKKPRAATIQCVED